MPKSNRILVPTNFTLSAEKAYEFALAIAAKRNLLIDLIHVIPTSVYLNENRGDQYSDLQEKLYNSEYKEAEKQLKHSIEEFIPKECRGKFYLKTGSNPVDVINDFASKEMYSMVIMSTSKQDSSVRLRVPEQVVRNSKVPVMILDQNTEKENINSILLPTDGSLLSLSAIPAALTLNELFDAGITLFYVNEAYALFNNHFSTKSGTNEKYEVKTFLINRMKDFFENRPDEYELLSDKNFKKLRIRILKTNKTVPVQIKIITGLSAHHEITKYANRSSDFVVMATHGRSGLSHLLMGSNTEKVAQNIKVPILTIRPESKFFEQVETEAKELQG